MLTVVIIIVMDNSTFLTVLFIQDNVKADVCLTIDKVKQALDQMRGAVMIVYPMGLPPHDPVRMELEDQEDLTGTQVCSSKHISDFLHGLAAIMMFSTMFSSAFLSRLCLCRGFSQLYENCTNHTCLHSRHHCKFLRNKLHSYGGQGRTYSVARNFKNILGKMRKQN